MQKLICILPFQQLIQASLSSGGHFQFKHEKSWDSIAAPSEYDKYFEINGKNLNVALFCIPFYERNDLPEVLFSERDIENMKSRASKYKERYENHVIMTSKEVEEYKNASTQEKEVIIEKLASDFNLEKEFQNKHEQEDILNATGKDNEKVIENNVKEIIDEDDQNFEDISSIGSAKINTELEKEIKNIIEPVIESQSEPNTKGR